MYHKIMTSKMKHLYKNTTFFCLVFLCLAWQVQAQSVGDYRTNGAVNFTAITNWQRYNGTAFVAATAGQIPSSTDGVITIRNTHTATVGASTTLDQVVIQSGGILTHTGGTFTVANGAGDDITVEGGGLFIMGIAATPNVTANPTIRIKTNGILRANDNTNGTADDFVNNNSSGKVIYENGAIFEWNDNLVFNTSNITFFPDATATVVPIFRLSVAIGTVGAANPTTINGIFEANANITWQGTAIKTFRNGITGTGNLMQNTAALPFGAWQITGTNAQLGGTGIITLNSTSGGLTIANTAEVTMTSNKIINEAVATNPTVTVAGILDCGTFNLTNNSGTPNFTLNSGATLKIGSPQGITSSGATGNIQLGGTRTFNPAANYEYKGTAAQVTGDGLPATLNALLTINNTAATPTVTQTSAIQTMSGLNSQMVLTAGNYTIGANTLVFIIANAPITRTGGKIATIATSNITFGSSPPITNLSGNTFTLPNDLFVTPTTLNNFTVDRTNNLALGNQGFAVVGTLSVGAAGGGGDLDLNGNNIDLGTAGTLSENRGASSVVTDNTVTTYNNIKGGYLRATARNMDGTDIAGLGINITNGTTGMVNIDRYHCKVVGFPVESIKKVFDITASVPANNATMTIRYSPQDLVGTSLSDATANFRLHRGQNGVTIPWTMQTSPAAIGTCHDITSNKTVSADNITSFSPWTAAPQFTILPVNLLKFKAEKVASQEVLLAWQTSNEENHAGFEIEQSFDGYVFEKIGFVSSSSGVANSQQIKYYQFIASLAEKTTFYRLKQLDHNGQAAYSRLEKVDSQANNSKANLLTVFPNPFADKIQIDSQLGGETAINAFVTDLTGKILWHFEGSFADFQTEITSFSGYAKGVYFLNVYAGQNSQVVKVVRE
jgi:hypothetical protein